MLLSYLLTFQKKLSEFLAELLRSKREESTNNNLITTMSNFIEHARTGISLESIIRDYIGITLVPYNQFSWPIQHDPFFFQYNQIFCL